MKSTSPSLNVKKASGQDWSERSGTLMAWAVRKDSGRATHVTMLKREETGLKCRCTCPACDGEVEAVNAGKTAEEFLKPGSMRPHFRHRAGQQRRECLQRVAQLAALELLATHQELVLPAPTFRRDIVGVSGDIYSGEATGRAYRARVLERHWVDHQTSTLTLDDGRVIAVCLSASALVSRGAGVDAVVTISIDDPLVATWSPEEIISRLQLNDRWLCWRSHWDEADLDAQALAQAQARAKEALDLATDDLVLPEGLTALQRSESVLHAVMKQILAESKRLRVPAIEGIFELRARSGKVITRRYEWPAVDLHLSNVRLETRMGGLVPDVVCDARDITGTLPAAELLVEVAVTHPVDADKLARIQALGIACVEVDARLMARGKNRIKLDELRHAVLRDPSNKRWVYHHHLEILRASAQSAAARLVADEDTRMEAIDRRRARLKEASLADVLKEHMRLTGLVRSPSPGQPKGFSQDVAARATETLEELQSRRVHGVNNEAFMSAMRSIASVKGTADRDKSLALRLVQDTMQSHEGKRWVTLLVGATEAYGAAAPAIRAQLSEIALRAYAEVREGQRQWARPRDFDDVIRLAFPELDEFLKEARGTVDEAEAFHAMVASQRASQRAKEAQVLEEQRAIEAELRREAQREAKLAALNAQYRWRKPGDGGIRSADDAKRLVKNYPQAAALRDSIIDLAWACRMEGTPFGEFALDKVSSDQSGIDELAVLLKGAWLVTAT